MELRKVSSIIGDIKQKGYEEGLTVEDYKMLRNLLNSIIHSDETTTASWYQLASNIEEILDEIFKSGILHMYSTDNCKYIIESSSLLPLVLANNKFPRIKMYGDNSYMFLCQFHREFTPSMGVSDIKNLIYCYACGCSLNIISYLKRYETLGYRRIIELLAQIFLYDIHLGPIKSEGLVEKYHNAIMSDEYMELLKRGHDRLKTRQKNVLDGVNIDEYYMKKFQTIERIKNREFDPDFQYIEPPKRMFLTPKNR